MAYRPKKRKPYGSLPRRRRKQMRHSVKNMIRKAAPVLGGLFYTHDYLHGQNGWVDCYFLGANGLTFYNCALQTSRYAYKELVEEAAWDAADKVVPYDYDRLFRSKSSAVGVEPAGSFGGHTRMEWIKCKEREIADTRALAVHAEVTLHHDYHFGIGLHATLDVPYLTVKAINDFIVEFLKNEKPYRSETPLTYSYEEIGYWGLESNAIVEPLEHPPANQPE